MARTDHTPDERPARTGVQRALYSLVALSMVLGAAHHVDHVVRGNHVGWPITGQVNPFTYSLVVYPVVAIGLVLTLSGRAGNRYWAAFFALSTAMLAYFHVSPWAVEPPRDVILPYADPAVGYAAFAILLALIASVIVGSAYATLRWYRGTA
ncbi:hypothetical protein [Haloarcula marina]|uniref:hypothetical protein n=1 Tax=Haloarcula marina TaxID=2961574 RepID=UPI0020B89AA7|nr:hypothetical protein [Halomicroarcula marina]